MAKKSNAQSEAGGQPRGVYLAEVEQLLAFMEKHGLEEFEYERDGVRVRLKKPSAHSQGAVRAFGGPDVHATAASSHASVAAATVSAPGSGHAVTGGAHGAEEREGLQA